jgi:hypothetical protein
MEMKGRPEKLPCEFLKSQGLVTSVKLKHLSYISMQFEGTMLNVTMEYF